MVILAECLYQGLAEDSGIWHHAETWGFQPAVQVVVPASCPLVHDSFIQLWFVPQVFLPKRSSCFASTFYSSSSSQELFFILSERKSFITSFLCLNGLLLTWNLSEKSVKLLPQLSATCWSFDKSSTAQPQGTKNAVTFNFLIMFDVLNILFVGRQLASNDLESNSIQDSQVEKDFFIDAWNQLKWTIDRKRFLPRHFR